MCISFRYKVKKKLIKKSSGGIWNMESGELLINLSKNRTNKNGMCFVKSKQAIISAQIDKPCINIYNLKKEVPLYTCSLSEKINCLTLSQDELFCFGGGISGTIYIWEVKFLYYKKR
jgi:WD40 repeat protein